MSYDLRSSGTDCEQSAYMQRAAAKISELYGLSPKACVVTFGCQQNLSDSERLKGMPVSYTHLTLPTT